MFEVRCPSCRAMHGVSRFDLAPYYQNQIRPLAEHCPFTFGTPMNHIKPSSLFLLAESATDLNRDDQDHLKNCADCQQVLAVFKTYIISNSTASDVIDHHVP
jgi:hypothetical protein